MAERYGIGETARILGISTQLLRHYESRELVIPHRDPNGYRWYDLDSVKQLTGIRRFRTMGFSLEEAELLLRGSSRDSTLALYRERLDSLRRDILWKQDVLAAAQYLARELEGLEESVGVYRLCRSPAVLRITNQQNVDFATDLASEAQQRWLDGMPVVAISPSFPRRAVLEGAPDHCFGYAAPLEKAESLGLLDTPGAQILPEGPAATTVIYSEEDSHISAALLRDGPGFLESQGYELAGDPWGITLGNFIQDGVSRKFHRVFLPAQPIAP